jgi:integrase
VGLGHLIIVVPGKAIEIRDRATISRIGPLARAGSTLGVVGTPTSQAGLVLFSKMVEKFKAAHVEAQVSDRFLLAKPTRLKYLMHLEQRIVPQWGNRRLMEIKPDEVQQWLFETCESWHMMNDLRSIMSGIYTKAEEWGYWPEGKRNPMSRVKIGPKWSVRPERILSGEETMRVLARLTDPNLLVLETAIATGARISELLGLKWRHIDLQSGVLRIAQRNWRGDIADPKSKTSKRPLTLGHLVDRYREHAVAAVADPEKFVFVRTDGSNLPLWDSGVRQALKRAIGHPWAPWYRFSRLLFAGYDNKSFLYNLPPHRAK